MAAPQENVRDIQEQVKRIQAALQALNTPEGPDRKTLAERLENSDTREYIVLRALLKKHLGFEYNEDEKIYECPLIESLVRISAVEEKIKEFYVADLELAVEASARIATQDLLNARDEEIRINNNLKKHADSLRRRILECNEPEELNNLEIEMKELVRELNGHEKYLKTELTDSYYRTFQYHISKRVGSLQERYYLDLESLLEGIKENSKKLYQQPVLRFSRDEMRMYNVKEDESSFREARERIAIDPVAIAQRNRDIGIAVQYLEDSMGGNYSGSKVYDYEPTQKVKDLLALINPLMVHYNKKKPKDLFPAYNQGNPDEASLLTVRTHLQPALEGVAEIRADLMQCEEALKTKRHINFLKNNAMEIVAKYQGSSDATEMVAELFGIEDRILSSLEVSENDPENIKELKRNTLAYELEWMKALKINVLKIRANYIRENYTGGNLGIASNELNRLEADLVRLGILESELKELRQIKVAVLREEGYYIVQRYRMNEISSQEMLTGLMVIEEQRIPLRENPSNQDEFQALRATLEEGKHLVNLIPPGNIMGILNAIGEAKYGNAREQLLAQLTILREEISAREEAEAISRQRQIASNSSSSSSSSGPSPSLSSGSAPSLSSSSLASSALSSSALSSKSRVTQRVDMKKGGVPSQASSLDLEHTESSQNSSATREIDANYLRQQFITNYKRIKMSASFSPFRSSERNYEGSRIEQIMDEVLMKPLTPYKKESTDSAKALRQALGCSKEDFLEVGKLYALFKAANGRDLSSTECFRTFVEWVQQEERIPSSPGVCQRVLGPFIEAQADLQQGSAPKVGKH